MSPLHNRNALELAIKNSSSIRGVLRYLGLSNSGDAYKHVRKWIEMHGLELPVHFPNPSKPAMTLDQKLRKGIYVQSNKLLIKLVEAGLKQNKCEECDQGNIWNGKPLTLHLDHIDGDHENNLIENLRILCPHCHQQTPTFGGKNVKHKPSKKYFCNCGQEKTSKEAKHCHDCYLKERKNFINQTDTPWPPVEDVLTWLETSSFTAVGKKIGVSDNAVRNYIKRSGHEVPKRHNITAK